MASLCDSSEQWVNSPQGDRGLPLAVLLSLALGPWEETLSPAGPWFPHLGISREEYPPDQVSCLSPAWTLYSRI